MFEAYARHLRGPTRIATIAWFGLIALSPLLTHQHHVGDIAGGFILAGLCRLLIRPKFSLDSAGPPA